LVTHLSTILVISVFWIILIIIIIYYVCFKKKRNSSKRDKKQKEQVIATVSPVQEKTADDIEINKKRIIKMPSVPKINFPKRTSKEQPEDEEAWKVYRPEFTDDDSMALKM
jgi:FtsZ-interacting cell division protein ZipA